MNKTRIHSLLLCSVLSVATLFAQTQAEYFIDTDPGVRRATKVSINATSAQIDVPTGGLAAGWHLLGVRALSNRASQTYTHRFFIPEQTQVTALSGAEYFVDSDPGRGSATQLPFATGQTAFSFDLTDTDNLSDGIHLVGMRAKYGNCWSQTYTHLFFVSHASAATELSGVEYWLDTDPGLGKATAYEFTPGQVEFALDAAIPNELEEGTHLLGVRVKYGDSWSQTYTHRFLHTVAHSVPTVVETVEAYWDKDTENPIAVPFVQQGDTAYIRNFNFDTQALSYGVHYLNIRAKANGVWSILTRYEVCKNAIPQFSVLDEESICVGQEVIILDESSDVQPETTYAWDMNGDGNTDITEAGDQLYTFNKAGRYTVTLTVQTGNGCESVYSHEIYVHPTAAPSVSLSRTKSKICAGESVTFTAKPTNGGEHPQYTWYRNGQAVEGATEAELTLDDLQNGDKVKVQLTTDNPCATVKTAMSSELTQTVNALPEVAITLASVYYTDDKAFSLSSYGTPAGGTFYINGAKATLFNPKNNPVGTYTVRYVASNNNGCTSEAETTFELKVRTNATITVLSANETMGTVTGGGNYPDGSTVTITATPNTGYHFVEWQDGVTTATREITVSGDATYSATFAINVLEVLFLDWDESVLKKDSVDYGNAATAPADPTREGYTFTGWDKEFSNVKADLVVTAQYKINRYAVSFLDWDNSVLKQDSVDYGSAATAPADPTREGYTFIGWDKEFSNVTANLTVTAQYKINRYEVLFLDWDESVLKKDSVDHGAAATAPADPTREGYTFTGWDKEFSHVTEDMTITALYEKVEEPIKPEDNTTRDTLDLSVDGISIEDWTINDATLNDAESNVSQNKYAFDVKGGILSIDYVTSKPRFRFQYVNSADKAKAFYIYPGKCYETGGKNGLILIANTQQGDTIKLEVAAKGSSTGNFLDSKGTYPINATALTADLTLPAKGSPGADSNGYTWRTLEYLSKGGDVTLKEVGGGYRIRLIEVIHVESPFPTGMTSAEGYQDTSVQKILRDGQLFILRDGKMYTIQGVAVK